MIRETFQLLIAVSLAKFYGLLFIRSLQFHIAVCKKLKPHCQHPYHDTVNV